MAWWILVVVLLVSFLFWADRRTRGRGNRDSGGTAEEPFWKYL